MAFAGTFAGLTLAFFSLKLNALETKIRLGDQEALRVYRLRKTGNLLLCTLLLGNVASYTAMTLFLDDLTPGLTAGIIATGLIFVFGEILPQAVFPRFALKIGARMSKFVWLFVILFYPLSAPISWLLDKILGKETPVLWSKEELGEIIRYHEDVGDGIIDQDEERIILGALSFSEITAGDIMIPKKQVFFVNPDQLIDEALLTQIRLRGFSRIPVIDHRSQAALGILYIRDLISLKPGQQIASVHREKNTIRIRSNVKLDWLLDRLISQKMQMAIIEDQSGVFRGIVTLEDIMEEILRKEIDIQH